MVCLLKQEGGLGVLNLTTHNESLLLKFIHKFFTRADIPWVYLVWENYYSNGKLPGQQRKGFFWWRYTVKLLDKFKGIAKATTQNGATILFWQDLWNDNIPKLLFPKLFPFAKDPLITVNEAGVLTQLSDHFSLPLSLEAFQQFQQLSDWFTI